MTSTFSSVALSARYPRVVVKRACGPLDCPAASVAVVVEVVELVDEDLFSRSIVSGLLQSRLPESNR